MDVNHRSQLAESARRSLRLQVWGFACWLALAIISTIGARTNPLMVLLVCMSGIGLVIIGRGFRASGDLLRVSDDSQPAWLGWLVRATFVAGAGVCALGLWLLLQIWRAAP